MGSRLTFREAGAASFEEGLSVSMSSNKRRERNLIGITGYDSGWCFGGHLTWRKGPPLFDDSSHLALQNSSLLPKGIKYRL